MSKWRTRMKRSRPDPGTTEFVLAVKNSNGDRMELDGVACSELINSIIGELINTLKLEKVESA